MATGAKEIRAPVSGWVTNLTTRIGDSLTPGNRCLPLSTATRFTSLLFRRNQVAPYPRRCTSTNYPYSDNKTLRGHVSSIGRAIYVKALKVTQALFRM